MLEGGNWWRENDIVIRHLTRRTAARYHSQCRRAVYSCPTCTYPSTDSAARWTKATIFHCSRTPVRAKRCDRRPWTALIDCGRDGDAHLGSLPYGSLRPATGRLCGGDRLSGDCPVTFRKPRDLLSRSGVDSGHPRGRLDPSASDQVLKRLHDAQMSFRLPEPSRSHRFTRTGVREQRNIVAFVHHCSLAGQSLEGCVQEG